MRIDYKDVRFSFRDRKIKRRRRLIKLSFLVLFLASLFVLYIFFAARRALKGVESTLLRGDLAQASGRLDREASSVFFGKSWRELGALRDLLAGRPEDGRRELAKLKADRAATAVDAAAFCRYFLDRGQNLSLQIYSEYLLPRQTDEAFWYCALSCAAFFDARGARANWSRISPAFRRGKAREYARLQEWVLDPLARGQINYVFDFRANPVAYFDLASRTTVSLVPGMQLHEFDDEFRREGIRFYHLTLDLELQRRVSRLMTEYDGSFVLLETKDSGIRVAFSKPVSENSAFATRYEPGSIIKVLTLLAFLQAPRQDIFPFSCRGPLTIAGRLFYDSLAHGQVRDFTEATALSCNLAFARMSQAAGSERLAAVLEKFFFNGPDIVDLFLRFKTGGFTLAGNDPYQLASIAVGLGKITITTLHAALIAAVVSRDGDYRPPFLIDHVQNILDLGIYNHPEPGLSQRLIADGLQFRKIRKAMEAVVEHEKGTARRARIPGRKVAAKTGTAGNRDRGLDAVVIGFFPLADQEYAFAFRLEGGGRAEWNGALLLKEFLAVLSGK